MPDKPARLGRREWLSHSSLFKSRNGIGLVSIRGQLKRSYGDAEQHLRAGDAVGVWLGNG